MDWVYKGTGNSFFKHNHSLNDGCGICKTLTKIKKQRNKSKRIKEKKEIKDYLDFIES